MKTTELDASGYNVSIEWATSKLNACRKRIRVCHGHATLYYVRKIASLHYFLFNNYPGFPNYII